jgi:phage tail sheath protein FI
MGRFDVLTTLDTKPAQPAPLPENAEPVQSSPLVKDHIARKETNQQTSKQVSPQTSLHANLQTRKPASIQASKPANQQTGLHANLQAGKQVSLQTGKQVMIEKYSSYLPRDYKRELKRIALETDREGYEVLIEAVEQYLEKQRK